MNTTTTGYVDLEEAQKILKGINKESIEDKWNRDYVEFAGKLVDALVNNSNGQSITAKLGETLGREGTIEGNKNRVDFVNMLQASEGKAISSIDPKYVALGAAAVDKFKALARSAEYNPEVNSELMKDSIKMFESLSALGETKGMSTEKAREAIVNDTAGHKAIEIIKSRIKAADYVPQISLAFDAQANTVQFDYSALAETLKVSKQTKQSFEKEINELGRSGKMVGKEFNAADISKAAMDMPTETEKHKVTDKGYSRS
ncbi:MAG: hypothetical protein ABJH04_08260 [Cyclobacteriaceae bacterium]